MAVNWLVAVLLALLWVLAALLAILLTLLLALLFLPVDIDLRLDSDLQSEEWEAEVTGAARWRARLRWGWWVLRGEWEGEQLGLTRSEFHFCGVRLRLKGGSKPKPARPKRKPKKQKGRLTFEQILAYAQEAGRVVSRSVKDLGIQIRGALTYGFPDPAFTGWCEGIRWTVLPSLPVAVTPEFERPCLIGWTEISGRTYGFRVVVAALKAFRNPVIRAHLASKIRFRPLRYLLVRGGVS